MRHIVLTALAFAVFSVTLLADIGPPPKSCQGPNGSVRRCGGTFCICAPAGLK